MYIEIREGDELEIKVNTTVESLNISIDLDANRYQKINEALIELPYNEDFKGTTAMDHILGILADNGVVIG